MNVQLCRRLEGYFRVHMVPEDGLTALCGSTSVAGWDVGDGADLIDATCPYCQAEMSRMSQPVTVIGISGGSGPTPDPELSEPPHPEQQRKR